MEATDLTFKRDINYWEAINWTEAEQIELEIHEGELVDVYERVCR